MSSFTTFPPIELTDVAGNVSSASTAQSIRDSITMLQQLVTDGVLYLAYGIAILCAFKFVLYMVNGVTSDKHMGARIMDDSSFFRGANGYGPSQIASIR